VGEKEIAGIGVIRAASEHEGRALLGRRASTDRSTCCTNLGSHTGLCLMSVPLPLACPLRSAAYLLKEQG